MNIYIYLINNIFIQEIINGSIDIESLKNVYSGKNLKPQYCNFVFFCKQGQVQ